MRSPYRIKMTSEFLRTECRSRKQAEFIINVDFLIKIKKVNVAVRYFYAPNISRATSKSYLLFIAQLLIIMRYHALPHLYFFSFFSRLPLGYLPKVLVQTTYGSPNAHVLVASFYARYHTRCPTLRNDVALLWESYFYGGLERGMRSHSALTHARVLESWVVKFTVPLWDGFLRGTRESLRVRCHRSQFVHDKHSSLLTRLGVNKHVNVFRYV